MKITNHRVDGAEIVGSPNRSGEMHPDTIVIHYTAGPTAASAIKTLIDPASEASAHIVVDTDGSVTQLVPFNIIAWHAGRSQHLHRVGLNKFSIGIEIVNAGRLKKTGNSYVSWFGRKYPPEEVFQGIHRNENAPSFWHQYTEAQITIVDAICTELVRIYGIKYILGHEEISPSRKIDPGPAFPLDKIRNRILNLSSRSEDAEDDERVEVANDGWVMATKLNIRSGPSATRSKIAEPLSKGTKVKVLEKSGEWYRVSATIDGWVAGKFIREI